MGYRTDDEVSGTAAGPQLDDVDLAILKDLQRHARIANVDLARRVGLSAAPCLRRVRALEKAGVIRKYVALLNPATISRDVTVFVHVSLDLPVEARQQAFEEAAIRRPEVMECYLTGDCDYLLRVVVPDVSAYRRFVAECLARIDGLVGVRSTFSMQQVKYSTELPLTASLDDVMAVGTLTRRRLSAASSGYTRDEPRPAARTGALQADPRARGTALNGRRP